MRYDYKVVPAPDRGEKTKGVKGPEGRFAAAIERIMNDMAERGWEYLRTDTLPSEERAGLTQTVTVWRNLLVFRRPNASDVANFEPRLLSPPLVLDQPVVVGRVPEEVEAEAARTAAALSPRRVERREALAQAAAAAAKVEAAAAAEPARRVISDSTEALADRLDARLRGVPAEAEGELATPVAPVKVEAKAEVSEDQFWDEYAPAEQTSETRGEDTTETPSETKAEALVENTSDDIAVSEMRAEEAEQFWTIEDRAEEVAELAAIEETFGRVQMDDADPEKQPEAETASAEDFDPFELTAQDDAQDVTAQEP